MSNPSPSPRGRREKAGQKPDSSAGRQPTIGSYRILEIIGKGGMGTVYKAVHTGLDRVVALKVLPTQYARNPILLKRFKREATNASRLHHPNIVAVYDQGESGGTYYLALEYVDGQDLHSLVRSRERISPRRCVEILKQATQALVHAHSKGIIHRDIKPSNLLARRDGTVKLADLGLATRGDAAQEAQVTRAGTTVGTVDYMPPEQARGSDLADARSDIYSLGCTLYHMLAGRPPFPEGSIPEKLLAHAKRPPQDIQQLNPEVTDELVAVINRMMAKDPDARYQSAYELLAELEQLKLRRGPAPREDLASLAEALDDEEPVKQVPLPSRPGPRASSDTPEPPRSQRRRPTASDAVEPTRSRRRRRAEPETDEGRPREPRDSPQAVPPATPPPLNRSRHRSARKPAGSRSLSAQQWMYLAGGAGVLLLIALIVYVMVNMGEATSGSTGSLKRDLPLPPAPVANQDAPQTNGTATDGEEVFPEMGFISNHEGAAPTDESTGAQPVLADALSRESFLPGWPVETRDEATRTLRLRRWASPTLPGEEIFENLQSACDAVRPGETVVIEIADQGPFFVRDITLKPCKKLILRAADHYAPLFVLDPSAPPTNHAAASPQAAASCLLQAGSIELELEGLHFATMLDRSTPPGPIALVRTDAHLTVRRCTFTVAQDARYYGADASGRSGQRPVVGFGEIIARDRSEPGNDNDPPAAQTFAASVAAIRVGDTLRAAQRISSPDGAADAQAPVEKTSAAPTAVQILFEDCFIRSSASASLSVEHPSAEVLIRNTLLVSGDAPALQVVTHSPTSPGEAITLRVIGSTLVSDRNGVLVARTEGTAQPPEVNVRMLDSIVSHPRGGRAGELLLADRWPTEGSGSGMRNASWQSRNSRYTGWSKLAAVTRPLRTLAATGDQWSRLWGVKQPGVIIETSGWPERPKAALGAVSADLFAPPRSEDATAANGKDDTTTAPDALGKPSAGEVDGQGRAIGCAVHTLPALPQHLYERAFEPFASTATPALHAAGPNQPALRIDLSDPKTDLATELRRAAWDEGQTIVVRGSGRRLVSPIRIEGKSLRLHFEPARRDEPLTLVPRLGRKGEAMIEVIGGDLEVVGGRFESTKAQASSPRWILRAAGGSVQLTNCWLKGPFPPTEHFNGVIWWSQGSTEAREAGEAEPTEPFCRLSNCLLVGSGSLVQASISGRHLFVENTAAASSGDVFDLELGSGHEPPGTVTLRQSTLWAHGVFFDLSGTGAAGEGNPFPSRLFASQCVFASPLELPGRQRQTTLLRCDPNLVTETRVAWHGVDNGYTDLVGCFAPLADTVLAPAEGPSHVDAIQFDRHWTRVWGPWHERHALLGKPVAWQSEDVQASELKPGDFMLSADSDAATWGPSGVAIGADVARLPKPPPEEERTGDEKKPVLNF